MQVKRKIVKNINGLNYFYLQSGILNKKKSNVILFLHGFPELSYSYRYLMKYFSKEGYFCIAPDQRGYGNTKLIKSSKDKSNNYSIFNLTKDIYCFLNALKIYKVNLVGHDFGSYVTCYFSLIYPNFIKSVVIMSMPFSGPKNKKNHFDIKKINKNLGTLNPARKHYQVYFSGKSANHNMTYSKQGIFNFLRAYYHFKSFDFKGNFPFKLKNISSKHLAIMPEYYIMKKNLGMSQTVKKYMPDKLQIKNCFWLTNKDLKVYAESFKKNTFRGPLNWYKMMLDPKESEKIINLKLPLTLNFPAIFIAGKSDWGIYQKPGEFEKMKNFFTNSFQAFIIQNAGHWVQQERPKKTFNIINKFYKSIMKNR